MNNKFFKGLIVMSLFCLCKPAFATTTVQPVTLSFTLNVTSASVAANGSVTALVSSPTAGSPYSSGYYNYITNVHIEMYATSTLTGGATPVTCTTTGLGGLQYYFPTAAATGTNTVMDTKYNNPLQATQGAQVTIVCPATASVRWTINVGSFNGQ